MQIEGLNPAGGPDYTGVTASLTPDTLSSLDIRVAAIAGFSYLWMTSGGHLSNAAGNTHDGYNHVTLSGAPPGVVTLSVVAVSPLGGASSVTSVNLHVVAIDGQPTLNSPASYTTTTAIDPVTVTIDNWDPVGNYSCEVSGGTFVRLDGNLQITPDGVSSSIAVSCAKAGVTGSTVYTIPVYGNGNQPSIPTIQMSPAVVTVGGTYLLVAAQNRGKNGQGSYDWSGTETVGASLLLSQTTDAMVFAWFDVTGALTTGPTEEVTIGLTETLPPSAPQTATTNAIPVVGWPRSNPTGWWTGDATPGAIVSAYVQAMPGMTYQWSVAGGTLLNPAGGVLNSGYNTILASVSGGVGDQFSLLVSEINAAGSIGAPTDAGQAITQSHLAVTIQEGTVTQTEVVVGQTYTASVTPNGDSYSWNIENGTITGGSGSGISQVTFIPGDGGTSVVLTATETNGDNVIVDQGTASAAIFTGAATSQPVLTLTNDAIYPVAELDGSAYLATDRGTATLGFENVQPGASVTCTGSAADGVSFTFENGEPSVTTTAGLVGISSTPPLPAYSWLNFQCEETDQTSGITGPPGSITALILPAPTNPPNIMVFGPVPVGTNTASVSARSGSVGMEGPTGYVYLPYPASTYEWTIDGGAFVNPDGASGESQGSFNRVTFDAGVGTVVLGATEISPTGEVGPPGSATVQVAEPPPHAITISGLIGDTVAAGAILDAGVSDQAGSYYYWWFSGGDANTSVSPQGDGSSVLFDVGNTAGAIEIYCSVTSAAGMNAVGSLMLVVVAPPAAPMISVSGLVNGNVTASTAGIQANVLAPDGSLTYSWSIDDSANDTGSALAGGGNGETVMVDIGSATGSFTLLCTATNAAGVTSAAASIVITVVAAPVANVTVASNSVAINTSFAATGPAAASCGWSVTIPSGANGSYTQNNNSPDSITVTAGSATTTLTISCTVTNAAGNSATASALVNVLAPPVTTLTLVGANANATPLASSIEASVAAADPGDSYTWSIENSEGDPADYGIAITGAEQTASFTTGFIPDTLTIKCRVTNALGQHATGTLSVTTVPVAVKPIITVSQTEVDVGASYLTASVQNQQGVTYVWTISNGGTIQDPSACPVDNCQVTDLLPRSWAG